MKYKKIMIALAATAALSAAGCGSSSKDTVEVTPTPVPTAAPTSGNSQSAADFNTGTEAYWCEDKYREICLSLKQHQG